MILFGFCHCKWLLFLVAFHNCYYCYRRHHHRQRQRRRRRRRQRRRRQRWRWWRWCNDQSHNSKTLRKHQKNHKWFCLKIGYIGYHHFPDDLMLISAGIRPCPFPSSPTHGPMILLVVLAVELRSPVDDCHLAWFKLGVTIDPENILVGGIPTPLKNMSSSAGMMKFPIYWKIKNVPNHQPEKRLVLWVRSKNRRYSI